VNAVSLGDWVVLDRAQARVEHNPVAGDAVLRRRGVRGPDHVVGADAHGDVDLAAVDADDAPGFEVIVGQKWRHDVGDGLVPAEWPEGVVVGHTLGR